MSILDRHTRFETEQRRTQCVARALDLAVIVLENGGSTVTAARAFSTVLKANEVEAVSALWRLDFVTVSIERAGRRRNILRPIESRGVNLTRISEATRLAEKMAKGQIAMEALDQEIERIRTLPPSSGRWITLIAAICTAACYAKFQNGDWGAMCIAMVAACVGQFIRALLQDWKFEVAGVTLICGVLSACIAAVGLRLGLTQSVPETVVASIVYLVPGLALINGFIDVISYKYLLVGIQRMANAVVLFILISVAIAVADLVVM